MKSLRMVLLATTAMVATMFFCAVSSAGFPGAGPGTGPPIHIQVPDPMVIPNPGGTGESYEYHVNSGFYFDPNAGPIDKWLNAPPNGWIPGQHYFLHEEFFFEQPPVGTGIQPVPLLDWHEEFWFDPSLPPLGPAPFIWTNWFVPPTISTVWPPDPSAPPVPVPGLRVEGIDTPTLWFTFDPIQPGTPNAPVVLHIWKEFQFVGDPNFPGPSTLPLLIHEHPTVPEPASIVIFAGVFAGACLLVRRRKG